ncbi:TPA: hypothetical protein ACH3X3_013516 [Trebouxia sp. C0006]
MRSGLLSYFSLTLAAAQALATAFKTCPQLPTMLMIMVDGLTALAYVWPLTDPLLQRMQVYWWTVHSTSMMRGCSQLALCYHYLHQHCYLFLHHLLHQLKHVLPAEFDAKILPLSTATASTFKLRTQHLANATARQNE